MTELDFYKWVTDNNIEYRWSTNNGEDDVVMWVSFYNIKEFVQMLSAPSLFDEGGLDVKLQDHYIALWAKDICEYFGLDIERIFKKD